MVTVQLYKYWGQAVVSSTHLKLLNVLSDTAN